MTYEESLKVLADYGRTQFWTPEVNTAVQVADDYLANFQPEQHGN